MSNGSGAGMDLDIMEVLNTATSELLDGHSDWSANMQIVDHVNGHPENAPKILEIVKKKVGNKKNEIALSSLALLEALVKNCPSTHPFVADKNFLEGLVKSLPKRVRDPTSKSLFKLDNTEDLITMERIDRTLVILQSWGLAFANSTSYPIFSEIYRGLQVKGVKFPEPDKNETAPVFTPAKRAPSSISSSSSSKQSSSKAGTATPAGASRSSKSAAAAPANGASSSAPASTPPAAASAASSAPAASAPVKFKDSECQVAWDSTVLLLEMASAALSFHELQANEVVTELLSTVQRAQKLVTSRLSADSTARKEWLMAELLCTNEAILAATGYLQQLATGKIKMGTKPPKLTPPATANSNANASASSDSKPQQKAATPAPAAAPAPAPVQASAAAASTPVVAAAPAPKQSASFDFFSGSTPASNSSPKQHSQSSATPSRPNPSTPPNSSAVKALLPPPPGSGGESKRRTKKEGVDSTPPKAIAPVQPPAAAAPPVDPLDLLFSSSSSSSSSSSATPGGPAATPAAVSNDPFDLFAAFGLTNPAQTATPAATSKKPKEDDDPFLALAARK